MFETTEERHRCTKKKRKRNELTRKTMEASFVVTINMSIVKLRRGQISSLYLIFDNLDFKAAIFNDFFNINNGINV